MSILDGMFGDMTSQLENLSPEIKVHGKLKNWDTWGEVYHAKNYDDARKFVARQKDKEGWLFKIIIE